MKKLNATNAIAILALGLTLSVVVAGCGGGNDTAESAVTKNAALSTTSTTAKAGSSNGGTGADCSTIAAMTNDSIVGTYFNPNTLTKSQLQCFSATQVNLVITILTESQIAALDVTQLTAITAPTIKGLSGSETQSFTTKQLKTMTDTQLQAILDSGEASDSQEETIEDLLS